MDDTLRQSFILSMKARNLSEETISSYIAAFDQFSDYVNHKSVEQVISSEVQEWLSSLAKNRLPKTVLGRYNALRIFFKWCVEEQEITKSPMDGLKRPNVPETPVEVPTDDSLKKILSTCTGRDFVSRRDAAVIRTWFDTGIRRTELANLKVGDIDLATQTLRVVGKGKKARTVVFGAKTGEALARYMRMRNKHPHSKDDEFWLGGRNRGAVGAASLYTMLCRRAESVGVKIHPHQLRHWFAHNYLREGGNEGDLMKLAGWSNRQMLDRYASSLAVERAQSARRQLTIGDKL